jgi:hypothetical protein
MKVLGWIVFIIFLFRAILSFGAVLEYVGTEGIYFYLGDFVAYMALVIYLYYKVTNKK